ncbi:MAG: hypothetical protein IKP38_04020 [Clostridia bacterium]|nr:hypothetical protein [Clostridia bacterium]
MKKRFIAIACILLFITFSLMRSEITPVPALYINGKKTAIKDLVIEEDYVILPLYKILDSVGKLTHADYNSYYATCISVNGARYVINFAGRVLKTEEDFINKTDTRGLLPVFNNENGPDTNRWYDKEVDIGNQVFIKLMQDMGMNASVEWDYKKQTVYIRTDIS